MGRLPIPVVATLLMLGGCSLIVDFDRSQLVDGGPDGGIDASIDGGLPFDEEQEPPPESDADAG